jgi:urease accessory protein
MSIKALAKEPLEETDPAIPPRSHVRACLELDFQRNEATRCTVLASSKQEPPLRVVRAFEMEDESALAHMHNVSGGLLGGDELALSVNVGAGACVQLTTTGATRIYRPRREAAPATQLVEVRVGENALLEYVPDPIIPFAGVRFSQKTKIHLARGAGLFWWEILAPGREARGEIFEYERVAMKTDISSQGRLIAAERVRLEPQRQNLASPARLGAFRYWAAFHICKVGLESSVWMKAEQTLRGAAETISPRGESLWGISTLVSDGLVVRGLTLHGRDAISGLQALWREAKILLYGRAPILPRKVN